MIAETIAKESNIDDYHSTTIPNFRYIIRSLLRTSIQPHSNSNDSLPY